MKRLIKQIAIGTNQVEEPCQFTERMYALAHDGTLWRLDDPDAHTQGPRGSGKWKQLPELPDSPELVELVDEDEGCPKDDGPPKE